MQLISFFKCYLKAVLLLTSNPAAYDNDLFIKMHSAC